MKYFQKDEIKTQLDNHPFIPPVILGSSVLQIAAFVTTRYFRCSAIRKVRKFISVADKSKLIAECWFQKEKEHKPIVVVINGFEGYEKKDVARFGRGVSHKAYYYGYNVVVLRQRGEGDSIRLTKSPGDFLVEDLPIALNEIKHWGNGKLYVIGISLGGWASFMAAGKLKDQTILSGLVGVSVPVSTKQVWEHIEKSPFFDSLLLRKYKSLIARRAEIDPPGTWDLKELKNITSKEQFFETYKHTFGYPKKFSTIQEFFALVDISEVLAHVKIPALIIHAKDDPAIPVAPFLTADVKKNKSLITLLPQHGSHACFVGKNTLTGDLDRHWAQNRALEFINLLEKQEAN